VSRFREGETADNIGGRQDDQLWWVWPLPALPKNPHKIAIYRQ